ncbi:MAG: hypothetical protein ABFD54_00780 [Armatimonadota bacterium]
MNNFRYVVTPYFIAGIPGYENCHGELVDIDYQISYTSHACCSNQAFMRYFSAHRGDISE